MWFSGLLIKFIITECHKNLLLLIWQLGTTKNDFKYVIKWCSSNGFSRSYYIVHTVCFIQVCYFMVWVWYQCGIITGVSFYQDFLREILQARNPMNSKWWEHWEEHRVKEKLHSRWNSRNKSFCHHIHLQHNRFHKDQLSSK